MRRASSRWPPASQPPIRSCACREAGAARGIPAAEIDAWCNAFEYVQLLRLREQHRRMVQAAPGRDDGNPNVVALAALPDLDRRILKEAMRQIRKMQQRLELDYLG